jgi:DNA-binding transcriptional LysR family regulator
MFFAVMAAGVDSRSRALHGFGGVYEGASWHEPSTSRVCLGFMPFCEVQTRARPLVQMMPSSPRIGDTQPVDAQCGGTMHNSAQFLRTVGCNRWTTSRSWTNILAVEGRMKTTDRISLRQLRCFVTLAEELHFRRAAERLHITQPPLTQRIQDMERELGVELFRRMGHRVELTDAGRVVLLQSQATLTQFDRIPEMARKADQGEGGTLRAAVVIAAPFIPAFSEATKSFKRDHPGIVLDLTWTLSGDGIRALRQRKIDLCLVRRGSLQPDGLSQVTVACDQLMLVLPDSHPRAAAERVALADVAEERFIFFRADQGTALLGQIMDLWARAGITPRIAQEADNGLAILALVAAGFGNAILPSALAGFRMPNVVWKLIDMDERWTASSLVMLYRPETLSEKLPSRFISYVQLHSSSTMDDLQPIG